MQNFLYKIQFQRFENSYDIKFKILVKKYKIKFL